MERNIYSAPVSDLTDYLESFAKDREIQRDPRKQARAAEARRRAAELAAGAPSVDFERVTYEVGDRGRFTAWRGTRDAVVAELNEAAEGWLHNGKPRLALAAHEGAEAVAAGTADRAEVGHITYEVVQGSPDESSVLP